MTSLAVDLHDNPLDQATDQFPSRSVAWAAVAVLATLNGFAFLDRQIISLLVAPMRQDLGISDLQISLLQGFSFALLYAIGGLPLGYAADKYSRRLVVFFGVLIWSLAAMACGLAQSYGQLLAARILVGLGEAALAPAAFSILSDMFPRKRLTFALGVYGLGSIIGMSVSLLVSAAILQLFADGVTLPLLGHLHSWQAAFVMTGAPGVIAAFLIFTIPEPRRHGSSLGDGTWADVFTFIRARRTFFTCHIVGFTCILTITYAQIWTPTFIARTYGWPMAQTALALAAFSLATNAFSLLFSGRTVDILQRRGVTDAHFRYYCVAACVLIVAGGSSYWAPQPWLFFVLAAIAYVPMNMQAVGASAIQVVTPAGIRGRVSALYLMVCGLFAQTMGPTTVAFFTDYVFHRDTAINMSLSATCLLYAPIALVAFLIGLKPMRDAVARFGKE
ncbi:MAG TPA: MFS transporter [Sphingobium sp.]